MELLQVVRESGSQASRAGTLAPLRAAGHRSHGLAEPSGWKGRGGMRARRDAARPPGPMAVPLTFSPPVRGYRHDGGQERGSPQGITDR
jgi:hypothetical protein